MNLSTKAMKAQAAAAKRHAAQYGDRKIGPLPPPPKGHNSWMGQRDRGIQFHSPLMNQAEKALPHRTIT